MDIEALTRDSARNLPTIGTPVAGEGFLRMDANTNLLGPNPAIRRVLERDAGADFAHYPSPVHAPLRTALAKHHGLEPEEILVGAGADELIDAVARAFVNPGDAVAVSVPTFELYSWCAKVERARVVEVPLGQDFELDPESIARAQAKVTFLASPNNPTGNAHPAESLERVIRSSVGMVVIDEAYAEFGTQNFLKRVREFPNLVVLRTFSKAYGLAGLRVGYAAGQREIINGLIRVKMPFSIGALSERIALEALADGEHVRRSREMMAAEKPWLTERLSGLGLHPYPSDANFLLVRVGERLDGLVRHLISRKIAVRPVPKVAGCMRVTVGRREHNERLVEAIAEVSK